MSFNLKPLKLWGAGGPNPPKVAMILSLLSIPHEVIPIPMGEVKDPKYTSNINPNGRIPSLQDPNTGLTLWESGAIIEYLIEKYDKERKLSFEPGTDEYFQAKQWLFFQVSGQGPYYGQAAWFQVYHPEKVPSAVERYIKEIHRVTGVLESWLSKQNDKHGKAGNGPWLVSEKMSYADISFVMWQSLLTALPPLKDKYDEDQYPFVKEWMGKMREDKAIGGVIEKAMASHGDTSGWKGFDAYLS